MAKLSLSTDSNKTAQILVVEDEYILALNLQESLEFLGYGVVGIVDSAEAAIEQAAELQPDLVLMDIRLSTAMDGVQAAEQIWHHLQIPVVFVTGHSDQTTVQRVMLTQPFGYILKPVTESELHVAIQTALSRYERDQFLSKVLRGMGDGVIVVDPQLRVKYLNQVAERLTGWQLDEVENQLITEIFPLIDERSQQPITNPIISALQQETAIHLENRVLLVSKDGNNIPIADSVATLKNNAGEVTGAVLVFRDDTKRRLIEERNFALEYAQQLKAQAAELERINRLKDDFLAMTSHELRTPLSNIKLAIFLLEKTLIQQGILSTDTIASSQPLARYLSVLRDQCEQELSLVNDLLDLRSLDAGAYPLDLSTIHLQSWLPQVVESFQARIQAQQLTLQVRFAPDLPPIVSDLKALTRIISELLNNACKYTPENEQILITAQVAEPLPDHQPTQVQLEIGNSGIEISPENQARIFEPFYRIPDSDRWKHGGTGLGLALVNKLVTQLNGSIGVFSSQGWTTFTIFLPLSNE